MKTSSIDITDHVTDDVTDYVTDDYDVENPPPKPDNDSNSTKPPTAYDSCVNYCHLATPLVFKAMLVVFWFVSLIAIATMISASDTAMKDERNLYIIEQNSPSWVEAKGALPEYQIVGIKSRFFNYHQDPKVEIPKHIMDRIKAMHDQVTAVEPVEKYEDLVTGATMTLADVTKLPEQVIEVSDYRDVKKEDLKNALQPLIANTNCAHVFIMNTIDMSDGAVNSRSVKVWTGRKSPNMATGAAPSQFVETIYGENSEIKQDKLSIHVRYVQ